MKQIYEVLKKDHEEVKELLAKLVQSDDLSDEQRTKLIQDIRDELVPHARAEEATFYNPLRAYDEIKDVVRHGYTEHGEAETLLRTLQTLDYMNADWKKVAQKLKDAVEHHIQEEETEIFEAAQKVVPREQAEMMASAFEQMKPEVRKGSFVDNTLDMVINMMPPSISERLRDLTNR